MVEKILKNIYRIEVEMPKNPLRAVNCYFIRGDESDLLIDTCFRRDECRQALDAGLAELGSDPSRRDVLVTHLHADHSGLANEYVGKDRRIYMSETDLSVLQRMVAGGVGLDMRQRMLEEGFPRAALDESYATNPAGTMALEHVGSNFHPLADDEEIRVGSHTLRTVLVPGHTPGNAMFWMEREKVMFTGDHVLFDVTPNIMAWPDMEDSLGSYLQNLQRSLEYPVELALPGHRKPGDYHERIQHLLHHHAQRVDEALFVVQENPGLNAYEIAGRMKWKIRADSWETFPVIQKWFAVGECLSHLDYLQAQGKLARRMQGDCWRYTVL